MYGKPGKKPPMWLHSIMKNEMKYLNGILHGKEVDEEFRPLLTGEEEVIRAKEFPIQ